MYKEFSFGEVMYICYVKLQESIVPVICEIMEQDKLLDTHIRLSETKLIEDNVLPIIDVQHIVVKKEDIIYYVGGDLKETSIEVFDALKRNREKALQTKKATEQFDEFIETTKEIEKIENATKPSRRKRKKT